MKALISIILLLSFTLFIFCQNTTQSIAKNHFADSIIGESMKYYTIPIERDINGIAKDVLITSTLINSNPTGVAPIIVASKRPFPNADKRNQQLCGKIGVPCTLTSSFINKSTNQNVNIAVFCQDCQYSFDVKFTPAAKTLRNLEEEPVVDESVRLNYFSGDGISALSVAFLIIFVTIIACVIMMDIYVHYNPLVEQPLKLGRVET